MDCFVCRHAARPQIVRGLRATRGPGGWARVCVPCAIRFDLDGQLLAGPGDQELVQRWLAHRSRNRTVE